MHESDNLCQINTMFEDLFFAFYLLITIPQRFFCECYCIFYGGPVSWEQTSVFMPPFSTVFELLVTNVQLEMHSISSTLSFRHKRIKFVTDAYHHVVCCDLETKNMQYIWYGTTFCIHCCSASVRIKSLNIVIIRHKLSLSCSIYVTLLNIKVHFKLHYF